jgi:uncharacterized OsmC-like protein
MTSDLRNAVAVPLAGTAVLVTMRRGARGPWTVIVDDTLAEGEMAGPPPGDLILAGIAACTIVTIAGVASRRGPDLSDMTVEFDVKRSADRFAIAQRTTLGADLSETDHQRMTRTAQHCPVGKLFTKRAIAIEDQVELRRGGTAPARGGIADGPRFLEGRVTARWIPESREWSGSAGHRVLDQEGEARIQIEGSRAAGAQRWGLLGGHSAAGWVPRPSSFATAGLAASTLMTLRARAASLAIDPATLRVEVRALSNVPSGGKAASQDKASEGETPQVRWLRHVTVAGAPHASRDAILAAMREDLIYGHAMRGDLLDSDEVVAASAPSAALA